MKNLHSKIAVLGAGNIGLSLAKGIVKAGKYKAQDIIVTRRSKDRLAEISKFGFVVTDHNRGAVLKAELIVIAVLPQQLTDLLKTIAPVVDAKKHISSSVVTGVSTGDSCKAVGKNIQGVRA